MRDDAVYLPDLLIPYVPKVDGMYFCPIAAKVCERSSQPAFIAANQRTTYLWNHLYFDAGANPVEFNLYVMGVQPVDPSNRALISGRKESLVTSPTRAQLFWDIPYWEVANRAHNKGLNVMYADGHASFYKYYANGADHWYETSFQGWDQD